MRGSFSTSSLNAEFECRGTRHFVDLLHMFLFVHGVYEGERDYMWREFDLKSIPKTD